MSRPVTDSPERNADCTSQVDATFETILADIVRGTYSSSARLPAERELSRMLGASRPTLREALRRLAEWNMVASRRGSGVVVKPSHEWSIEALPAYLRYGKPAAGDPTIPEVVRDLLAMRRLIVGQIATLMAGRIAPGDLAPARRAARLAWDARHDGREFLRLDFEVLRAVAHAARFQPFVWLLNRLAGVYVDLAGTVVLTVPDDYPESLERYFGAIESGDGEGACTILREFLERQDGQQLRLLGVSA